MTHLPECSVRTYTTDDGMVYEVAGDLCICPALRACEQRSYALGIEVGKHDGWIAGHAAGLSAARDAVAALPQHWPNSPALHRGTALAAIDALTDGGCRTPDDPCADPDACDSLTCARERLHLTLRDEADALAAIDALRGEA